MKIYSHRYVQFIPVSLEQAWEFFSAPTNLAKITPPELSFKVTSALTTPTTYAGQIICYRLKIIPFVPMGWVTEITHAQAPHYFVDEQRFGPYAFWHHQHHFRVVDGGVEMTDEVHYAIPFGWLGRLANSLFVASMITSIFDYRRHAIETLFNKEPHHA